MGSLETEVGSFQQSQLQNLAKCGYNRHLLGNATGQWRADRPVNRKRGKGGERQEHTKWTFFFLKSAVLLKTNGLAFRTWTNISYVDSLLKSTHGAWLRSWLSGLWKRSPRRPRGKGFLLRVTWQFYCHPAQMTLNQHRWTSCQGVLLPPVRGHRKTPSFSRPSSNYWPFVSSKSARRVHTIKLH